jgi:hypothetical protein
VCALAASGYNADLRVMVTKAVLEKLSDAAGDVSRVQLKSSGGFKYSHSNRRSQLSEKLFMHSPAGGSGLT